MDFEKLAIEIAKILERLDIPYAITGGYALSQWGRLRTTFDIDTIIVLPNSKTTVLSNALKQISEMSYIDEQMVVRAVDRKGEFNFIHTESGIKVDFWVLKSDEFSASQLKRRRAKIIGGHKIYFLSPDDLILSKLLRYKETGSTRQLEDVESILTIQKKLDWRYMTKWAGAQNTLQTLEKLRKKIKNK